MSFMGNSSSSSRRQAGLYQEKEQAPGKLSSYHHHHHRGWLDNHGEGVGSSQLELMMMDSSPAANNNNNNNNNYGGIRRAPDEAHHDHDGEESCHHEAASVVRGITGGDGLGVDMVVEKEHMFDKVVTPSDVGKLNRLVIPKQHAERYFPLDSSTNEKGLLLNFEDRNGKPWRFRYSYWNSSQSYVMTKGWSRFVKEKKLDAGDIVSFQRGAGDSAKDRLFIDWRRPSPQLLPRPLPNLSGFPHHQFSFQRNTPNMLLQSHPQPVVYQRGPGRSNLMLQPFSSQMNTNSYSYPGVGGGGAPYSNYNRVSSNYLTSVVNQSPGDRYYFRSGAEAAVPLQVEMVQMQRGGGFGIDPPPPVVFESVPVVHRKATSKRLRLFGVNMDCTISEEEGGDPNEECHILSPTATNPTTDYNSYPHQYISSSSRSSSSSIPYLQLRPFNSTVMSSSDYLNKSKSSMSLDLDI